MKINNYEDLTKFIYNELDKLVDCIGIEKPSKNFIRNNEKQLNQYIKLFYKPLYRKAKRELAIQEAIDTMPHSAIWKFFNSSLWKKVQYRIDNDKEKSKVVKEEKIQNLYPIVQSRALEPIIEDE